MYDVRGLPIMLQIFNIVKQNLIFDVTLLHNTVTSFQRPYISCDFIYVITLTQPSYINERKQIAQL